jgi:hypothetical protein
MPATSSPRRHRPLARWAAAGMIVAAVGGAVGTAGLAGCYYPGGPGYSADRFTYESTTWQPWTVTLQDTRTGQDFWSVEVPVGQQLVVGFVKGEGLEDEFVPDLMQWQLMPIGNRFGGLENSIPVPPANARLLLPRLRKAPELPADMVAAQGGPPPVRIIEEAPAPQEPPAPE